MGRPGEDGGRGGGGRGGGGDAIGFSKPLLT